MNTPAGMPHMPWAPTCRYVDAWGQERLLVPLIGAVNPQAASTMSETCQLSSPRSPTNTSLPGNSSSRPAGAAPGAGAGVSTHQQQGLQAGSATAESVLARRLRLALEAATAAATASEAAGRQADRFSSGGGGTGAGASTSSSLYVTPAGSYGGAGKWGGWFRAAAGCPSHFFHKPLSSLTETG
jgi:hypothetical protein